MADYQKNYGRGGACGCGRGTTAPRMQNGTRQNGCGCGRTGNRMQSRREEAGTCCEGKEKLKKLEFSIIDTALYLDAYPDSDCALAYYHKLLEERDCLRKKLAEECGPTNIYENVSTASWDWVDGPWPWQVDAN